MMMTDRRPTTIVSLLLGVVGLTACGARPVCPAPAPVAVAVAPPAPPAAVTPTAPDAPWPRPPSPCWARGRPHPAVVTKKPAEREYCAPLDADEVGRIEQRVRKDFVIHDKPSKLIVDWGCDEAYGSPRELVFESGSGHGGSLRIVRMQWSPSGVVTVRRIDSSHHGTPHLSLETAETTAAKLEPLLEKSRVAMVVRPHLVRLAVKNGGGSGGASFSSNDFHLLLRITDEKGKVSQGTFTGYDSSSSQERILPMRYATEPLVALLATLSFRAEPATDDDRAFFTDRFLATLANEPYWWVRERYVHLAGSLGTPDAVPALALLAQQNGDASVGRTRDAAIDAIEGITGWKARVSSSGAARTTDEAARAVAEECVP